VSFGGLSDAEIEAMIQERQAARKLRNFAQADRIRNELQAQGIALIDSGWCNSMAPQLNRNDCRRWFSGVVWSCGVCW